ncbi:unnamed protein product [Coregonus sp. 'balchen']|nr:unnamed protein product [Coregonus sp. 'balchen']
MSTSKEQAAISKVMSFLQEWDHGNKTVRIRMLTVFLTQNTGKTCPELELEFAQVASLFLARLTAWMRLTYMFGTCLGLQLKAVGVFLSAASNHRYLIEFLEVGGVLTLMEILGQKQTKEEDKAEALRLLQIVSDAGRKYKELVCESYGVRAIAECLAKSKTEGTQETARALLESLAHGNPKYQNQDIVKAAHPSIVGPLLNLLRSLHLEVQYEAIELITDLRQYEVRPALLRGLVALLKPAMGGVQRHKILEDPEMTKMTESLPVFVQQAAAAKALRLLAQVSQEQCQELLPLRVHFVRTYPVVEEHHKAETLYMKMDEIQADILLSNKVNISEVLEHQSSED